MGGGRDRPQVLHLTCEIGFRKGQLVLTLPLNPSGRRMNSQGHTTGTAPCPYPRLFSPPPLKRLTHQTFLDPNRRRRVIYWYEERDVSSVTFPLHVKCHSDRWWMMFRSCCCHGQGSWTHTCKVWMAEPHARFHPQISSTASKAPPCKGLALLHSSNHEKGPHGGKPTSQPSGALTPSKQIDCTAQGASQ